MRCRRLVQHHHYYSYLVAGTCNTQSRWTRHPRYSVPYEPSSRASLNQTTRKHHRFDHQTMPPHVLVTTGTQREGKSHTQLYQATYLTRGKRQVKSRADGSQEHRGFRLRHVLCAAYRAEHAVKHGTIQSSNEQRREEPPPWSLAMGRNVEDVAHSAPSCDIPPLLWGQPWKQEANDDQRKIYWEGGALVKGSMNMTPTRPLRMSCSLHMIPVM